MKKLFNYVVALVSMFALVQSASATNVTFNVTVPSPTYQCWIVGNFNGWNNNDKQMTKVDDTHFTITMDDATWALDGGVPVTAANVKYKYLSGGGDWAFVEKDSVGGELNDRTYVKGTTIANPDPKKTTKLGNNGNDVVQKWALVFNPTVAALPKFVTIGVSVPKNVVQVYLVGNFCNWALPTDSTKMDVDAANTNADANAFKKKIWTADANKLQYKFTAGPAWDYEQTASANFVFPAAESEVAEVVTAFKAIYDPTKLGTINITANVPLGTDSCFLQGSIYGWNMAKAQVGTKVADGKFTFAVKDVMSMEYRLYNRPDWSHPEVDSLGAERKNRVAAYPADANITITAIGWKIPMGISQISKDSYTVYSKNSTVVVNGAKSQVELFNAAGQRIVSSKTSGTFTSKKLTSGMYIVRVDGVTRKVVIK